MGSGTNGIPGAATVVPFTNRTSAPCGPRRPAFFNWRDFKDWVVSVLGSHTVELSAKAAKAPNPTAGDLAALDASGNPVDSGLRADELQPLLVFDTVPTAGSLNPVTSGGIKQAIDAATPSDYDQVRSQVSQNAFDIDAIEEKIPAQASAQNQLADKEFVNSSIATSTATFRGTYNLVTDLGLTTSATHEQVAVAIKTKLAALSITPDHNDYCFVQVPRTDAEPTVIARIDRYKCSVEDGVASWDYEWSLNNSSFTAVQWAAINSGITSGAVAKLDALPTAQELAQALAGKASAADATLTPIYSNTPAFSEWVTDDDELYISIEWNDAKEHWTVQTSGGDWFIPEFGGRDYYSTSLGDNAYVFTATRTRTDIIGYTLGSQSDKPLQPQGDYALLSEVYAAVQQIAPAWVSGTVYPQNALVSYNGVVYRYKVSTVLPSTVTPDMDATRWEAKKASELFLPLTGGTMTGSPILDGCSLGVKSGAGSIIRPSTTFYGSNKIVINNEEGTAATVLSLPHSSNIDSFRFYTLATLEDIAPQFSESATYAAGDMCVYGHRLYRCTTAVTTAGAWNSANWTEATVRDILSALALAVTLTPVYSFSEWTVEASDGESDITVVPSPPDGEFVVWMGTGDIGEFVFDKPNSQDFYATELHGTLNGVVFTATRTCTDIIGYTLGDQTDKPLQPQGDYAPATNIAKSALAQDVQASLGLADTALQTAPVTSVNNKTGAVVLDTTDIQDSSVGASLASLLSFMNTAIQGKAPLASPAFTGTPTAPTPASGDNSTKVATTAFVQAAIGGITPGPDNTKLDATSAAPAFSTASTYAVGEHVTYNGKLYRCTTAVTVAGEWNAANWTADTMTDPDAVLDITSQNQLRVVAKDGTLLWAQGYDLASASSATLACDAVNNFTFADGATSQAFALPTAPTGKVGDFILDIDNSANTGAATMTLTGLDTTLSVVVHEGESLTDMLAITAGELARFYITLTTFRINNLPTWQIVKQVVENGGATA